MHTALVERIAAELGSIRQHVLFSAKLRAMKVGENVQTASSEDGLSEMAVLFQGAPDSTSWRVIDHCSAVTRSYALFEEFVFGVLREYISFLARSYSFKELGDDFAVKYSRGIGQIFLDQEKARYGDIDVTLLLVETTMAMTEQTPYKLEPKALLQTEQNLRWAELQRLFGHSGLHGVDAWIPKHRSITSFFEKQSRLSDTAESELKQIVIYRNEASHGEVDQVLGTDVLIEVADFFEALLISIADFVQYDMLRRAKETGHAKVVGVISEQFHDDIVVAKIINASIGVGDALYVFGKGFTGIAKIRSLQVDDLPRENLVVTTEQEIGMALGVRGKVGCELIQMT